MLDKRLTACTFLITFVYIQVWSLTAGKLQHDIHEHCLPITSLEFHPRKELLASTSADRQACFWNVQDGDLVAKVGPGTSGDFCFLTSGLLKADLFAGMLGQVMDPIPAHHAV